MLQTASRTLLSGISRGFHKGVDDALVEAYRLLPRHPLRLCIGPLKGNPSLPVGGVPDARPLDLPPPSRRAHVRVHTPVDGVHGNNAYLHLHSYPARGTARGVAVLCPFWLTPSPLALMPYIRLLQASGMHTVLYVPPDHLQRTPGGGWFSGERILGWDFPHMEDMLQLVAAELREVTGAYRRQGLPVVMLGLSLGGLYAAMAAVAGAPVDGLAMLTPAADMQVSMNSTRMGARYRQALLARGDAPPPEDLMTRLGTPYRPATWARPLPADRVFLAHGTHDAVVPLGVASELATAWDIPLHTYRAGHMSLLFLTAAVKRDLRAFVRRCSQAPLQARDSERSHNVAPANVGLPSQQPAG